MKITTEDRKFLKYCGVMLVLIVLVIIVLFGHNCIDSVLEPLKHIK